MVSLSDCRRSRRLVQVNSCDSTFRMKPGLNSREQRRCLGSHRFASPAVRQTEYEYLRVLEAVCPQSGHIEGLLSPRLNTSVVNSFIEVFSETIPADEHAVMIWDGAGFHRSKTLRVPENISLIQLTAYSPELNPVENLWHCLKSHYWSNHVHAD